MKIDTILYFLEPERKSKKKRNHGYQQQEQEQKTTTLDQFCSLLSDLKWSWSTADQCKAFHIFK